MLGDVLLTRRKEVIEMSKEAGDVEGRKKLACYMMRTLMSL